MELNKSVTKLIVGLGNHSLIHTRHSIGMVVLNIMAKKLGITWQYNRKCAGFVAQSMTNSHKIILLKPKLPMNVNGRSIFHAVKKFGIEHSNVYLVHDHLDKKLGKIQVKLDGSAGGHNGVKSAISCLKTDKIKRFRIGIDRPASRENVVKYVLQDFRPGELLLVERTIKQCVRLIIEDLDIEIDEASMESNDTVTSSLEVNKVNKQVNSISDDSVS